MEQHSALGACGRDGNEGEGVLRGVASRLSSAPHLQTPCRAFPIPPSDLSSFHFMLMVGVAGFEASCDLFPHDLFLYPGSFPRYDPVPGPQGFWDGGTLEED